MIPGYLWICCSKVILEKVRPRVLFPVSPALPSPAGLIRFPRDSDQGVVESSSICQSIPSGRRSQCFCIGHHGYRRPVVRPVGSKRPAAKHGLVFQGSASSLAIPWLAWSWHRHCRWCSGTGKMPSSEALPRTRSAFFRCGYFTELLARICLTEFFCLFIE